MNNDIITANAKINKIFKLHHAYYNTSDQTRTEQQAGGIEQVSKDYEGRAIYELLQNAFDRAESNILIKVTSDALYIANDGKRFTYAAEYAYKAPDNEPGDFQTLCSMYTSRKNRNESIGNKGIGFKSVFEISESGFVSIHTKGKIIGNDEIIDTGFKLCNLFVGDKNKYENKEIASLCPEIKEKINTEIKAIQNKTGFENRGVPGFFFPIPLHPDNRSESIQQIFLDERKFVTIIEIPLNSDNSEEISAQIRGLTNENFKFITLIHNKDITLFLNIFNEQPTSITTGQNTNYFFHAEITNNKKEHLQKLTQDEEVSIKNYKIAICFKKTNGKIYNFLPTQQESPLKNVDIHADFQTKIDRKSVDFKDGTIGEYNRALLKACIELYFAVLNSYIDEEQRIQLQLEYIDQTKISSELKDFDWSFLSLSLNS